MIRRFLAWFLSLFTVTMMLCSCTVLEPYVLGIYKKLGLKPDNVAEEVLEEIAEAGIKYETGLDVGDIDITPSTPEL